MPKIKITFDVYDEHIDEEDSTGLNVRAFEQIETVLREYGDDIEIERVDD